MSFLRGQVDPSKGEERYVEVGYVRNPFPTQGEVLPDVYVPRPELEGLQADLVAFLSGRPQGKVWALSGEQGVGKSNFLRMLEQQLEDSLASGEVTRTGFNLFHGNAWSPANLVAGIATAIGQENVGKLLKAAPPPPAAFEQTDFGRFWTNACKGDQAISTEFLIRWLAGGQTYAAERVQYKIQARDRLAPAIAVPYLRALLNMLSDAGVIQRIVLLFDELENMQAIKKAQQEEYMQLLKTLLNAFNWQGLYVILAGAPAVFGYLGTALPSLASRWELLVLEPIRNVDQALALAREYKKHFMMPSANRDLNELFPTEVDIKAAYVDLAQAQRGLVRQRTLLTKLHGLVETKVEGRGPKPLLVLPRRP